MPDPDQPRLIEVAFPLKQASLDSVHEKHVRHGHTANLKPMEIQELADQIGEITNAAVGYDLKIQVRIEIGSAGNRPPDDLVGKLSAKLGDVSQELKLG
jgi:hypothetical protein